MLRPMIILAVGAVASGGPARSVDLSPLMQSDQWRAGYPGEISATSVPNAMGDNWGLVVECKASKENTTYASIRYQFDAPVNMSGLKSLAVFGKADVEAKPKVSLECEGGSLYSDFHSSSLGAAFKRFEFSRDELKTRDEPDLTQVRAIAFGFGLWAFDTTEGDFSLTLAKLAYHGTENEYLIPMPKRGVSLDGQFKDWGFEDSLYNWRPPDYVYLNAAGHVVPESGAWQGPRQLSGRFAFMMDDAKLYFLGLVADATPFEGNDPNAPWKNDSVEVFLAFEPSREELRLGGDKDAQIVFDCGVDTARTRVSVNGSWVDVPVSRKTVPHSWVIRGQQTKGYVLEASVPLKDLGVEKRERGALIAYSLKLNDASGLGLLATPRNLRPHATVEAYRLAYVELASGRERETKFGPPARDVQWPARYNEGDGGVRIWDMTRAHRKTMSQTHERVYLNTLWAAQAVDSGDTGPDPNAWAYAPVPMGLGWYTPVFAPDPPDGMTLGREQNYSLLGGREKSFFWYERLFEVEPAWLEGRSLLQFEYVVEEATVYLNEQFLGRVDSAHTTLDVTGKLKSGEKNRLDVFLYTTISPGYSIRNGKGITGDVYLEHHKYIPAIDDVWVKNASGIDGSFEVVVERSAVSPKPSKLAADVLDTEGRSLAHVEADATEKTVALAGRCRDFRPWSPEQPVLFTLRVRCVRGNEVIDERLKRFGFRTFEIRNARFMLNGKVLRLRVAHATGPSAVFEPDRLRWLKLHGHNSIFMHAGQHGYNEPLFAEMDEEGLVAFAPMDRSWPDEKTVAEIRRYRSHPSLLGYVSDQFGQLTLNGFSHNPFSVSDTYYPESKPAVEMYRFLRRRRDLFQSVDPTRPYFPHATGNFEGSLRTTNHYPTFDLNLLDHAMYYEPWSKREDPQLPYHLYECGVYALHSMDCGHPEHKFPVREGREVQRWVNYEMAARYLGTKAFDDWRQWDAMMMKASVRGFRLCGIDGFTPWVGDDVFLAPCNTTEAQDIKDNRALSYRHFLLPYKETLDDSWMRMNSWYYTLRAQARWQWPEEYGQGKLKPKSSHFTSIYENEMQPLLAFLGGPTRDVFALEHNYLAGEKIEKQIVAVNDTESEVTITASVTFTVNRRRETEPITMVVPQGATVRKPFAFAAPNVTEKTRATVRLECSTPGGETRTDERAVTVFPRPSDSAETRPWKQPNWSREVGVVSGSDANALIRAMGVPSTPVALDRELPGHLDLVVIERNALTKSIRGDALSRFIDGGGQVLILEQTAEGLLDWRLRERRLEAAFIADRGHPIVAGLDDDDLAYWRGRAMIVPREKRPSTHYRHTQSTALETPHLTNEGLVASYVFEKPCYGDFHPILVGGYDLEESPLIEMRSGKGRVVFCQMDVSDRYGVDAAATLLADNIMRYLVTTEPEPRTPAVTYVGGPRGEAFLDQLGIAHVAPTDNGTPMPILVLGEGALAMDRTPVGATLVVLPFADCEALRIRAVEVRVQKLDHPHYWNTSTYQFTMLKSLRPAPDRFGKAALGSFRGLVENDVYFFESPRLKAFSFEGWPKEPKVVWRSEHGTMADLSTDGRELILCSVDPLTMEHDECRRKAWRLWSVIFSNLGVANRFSLKFAAPPLDLSQGDWTFLTDPGGEGEKQGYPEGRFGSRVPRPIRVGQIWEEQGVDDPNPNFDFPPDSAYDGFGWYFRTAVIPASVRGKTLYLHVNGVRDITTFSRVANQTDLWINGKKVGKPGGVYNAREGGRGARLWQIDPSLVEYGAENLLAVRVYNDGGAGGIHRAPVRFEVEGQNEEMLFPYEFGRSKYDPYFFWAW